MRQYVIRYFTPESMNWSVIGAGDDEGLSRLIKNSPISKDMIREVFELTPVFMETYKFQLNQLDKLLWSGSYDENTVRYLEIDALF